MNIPFRETLAIDIGLVIFFIALGFLSVFIYHRVLDFFRKTKKHHKEGFFGCLLKFLLLSTIVWLGIIFVAYGALMQSFTTIDEAETVAEVICEDIIDGRNSMEFTIILPVSGNSIREQFIGDRWYVTGEILYYHDLMAAFGRKPQYRLIEIGGKFGSKTTNTISGNAYKFLGYQHNPDWQWFYNLGIYFPFVKELKVVTISNPPIPFARYSIQVSEAGITVNSQIR